MIFKLAHLSTFAMIVAKLLAIPPVVGWSWWAILAPSLVSVTIGFMIIGGMLYVATRK